VLWGASFPLALASVAPGGEEPGRLVGRLYAANTVGAIAGAVGFSVLVIPMFGTQHAQQALIAVSAGAALLMLVPILSRRMRAASTGVAVAAALVLAAALASTIAPVPPVLVAYGRSVPADEVPAILFVGEGMNSSVAVSELASGVRNFHVSGKVEASTESQDMRLQRMLGNLPALFHPNPRSVLVVGFGAGVTAGSFIPYPQMERLVICEIEPLIPLRIAPFFRDQNYAVLDDPRVRLVDDDARHYVLTTQERFDIITSDPIHPWVKGAATLYTREYFEQVRRHLNPGGIVTQWVPLYESSPGVVKSEIATFFTVFPHGTIWGNTNNGDGYDIVLVGQAEPLRIDIDRVQQRLFASDYSPVASSLRDVGFSSAMDLLATYAGYAPDLATWLKDAEINRDRNLRLQYMAGMFLNTYQGGAIYSDMLLYRRFPDDIFAGSMERRTQLWQMLGRPGIQP
jgi:spermidine synthase